MKPKENQGRPPKDPGKKFSKISISIPPELKKELTEISWKTGDSVSALIADAMQKMVDDNKNPT